MHVEYEGTNYCGWQIQQKVATIQGELAAAIRKITGVYPDLYGCSRTDKGVHALHHVSNFWTASSIPGDRFCHALNSVLPCDIAVKESFEEEQGFHARFSCVAKKYRYRIYNHNTRSSLLRNQAWFEPRRLDIEAMQTAAKAFIGEYDFSAFQAVGSTVSTSVREIYSAEVTAANSMYGGMDLYYEVAGNGFLYNMVRIMAGTLVDVGKGRISPEKIKEIILSKDRTRAGVTAPPQGLYLKEVYYSQHPRIKS